MINIQPIKYKGQLFDDYISPETSSHSQSQSKDSSSSSSITITKIRQKTKFRFNISNIEEADNLNKIADKEENVKYLNDLQLIKQQKKKDKDCTKKRKFRKCIPIKQKKKKKEENAFYKKINLPWTDKRIKMLTFRKSLDNFGLKSDKAKTFRNTMRSQKMGSTNRIGQLKPKGIFANLQMY